MDDFIKSVLLLKSGKGFLTLKTDHLIYSMCCSACILFYKMESFDRWLSLKMLENLILNHHKALTIYVDVNL